MNKRRAVGWTLAIKIRMFKISWDNNAYLNDVRQPKWERRWQHREPYSLLLTAATWQSVNCAKRERERSESWPSERVNSWVDWLRADPARTSAPTFTDKYLWQSQESKSIQDQCTPCLTMSCLIYVNFSLTMFSLTFSVSWPSRLILSPLPSLLFLLSLPCLCFGFCLSCYIWRLPLSFGTQST